MIYFFIIFGLIVLGALYGVGYDHGKRAGREYESRKLVGGKLSGEVELRFPLEDLWSLSCYGGQEMRLTFRRTDRIAIDLSDCKHQTLPLSALARESELKP